jgi:signal transduction histidine kinase
MSSTTESRAGESAAIPAIDTTLLRIVVVFRIVGMCWLVALAVLTLATRSPEVDPTVGRTATIWSAIAISVIWTALTAWLAYRRPAMLAHWGFLLVDLVLAAWVAMTPGLIRADAFFAGGYPISSPFLFATTRGMTATIAPALVVAAGSAVGASFANARVLEVLAINFLSPIVLAWAFGTIKQQDTRRRDAEEALAVERTKLARADERAEMAAHLHDSVLQTLALIQRRAPTNREVTRLARRQERELRTWLNGGSPLATSNTVSAALIRAAEEVEDEYDVIVEVSTAGDRELDDRLGGVVLAAREAMKNAARFAGVGRIFILSEMSGDGVRLVVRDQGQGFDVEDVPPDRRGIRESIVGRLERIGGSATIRSTIGDGTEVELYVGETVA